MQRKFFIIFFSLLFANAVFSQNVNWYVSEGDFYREYKDFERAFDSYQTALDIQIAQTGENSIFVFALYERIGLTHYEQGNLDSALEYFHKSLDICVNLLGDDNNYLSDIYYYLSQIYGDLGDYKNAVLFGEKGLAIHLKYFGDDGERIVKIYNSLSLFCLNKGDFNNALGYALKMLSLAEKDSKINPTALATFYDNIGGVYNEMGDFEAAFKYFLKALDLRLKSDSDFLGLAFSYNNIALICQSQNDIDRALHFYFQALENYEKLNYTENQYIATVYSNIATCYNAQNKYDDANLYNAKALKLRENILGDKHPETAISYSSIAWNCYGQGDMKSAVTYWKNAYEIWEHSTNYSYALVSLKDILFSQLPDPAFTRETLTLATDTVERARLDLASLKDDILRKSLPIYYYGVQFEAEQKNPKKAFEYSESLRSRGFLDQIGTEAALKLDGVTESEREQIHSLTAEITYQRKIIEEENAKTLSEHDEARLGDAGKKLSEAEKSLADLDKKIARRIPAYAQLRNPVPVTAGEAQKWCGKNRVVLEYVLWNPELSDNKDAAIKSYCIVLTKKKVSVVELDGSYDYAAAIDKLRGGIMGMKRESQFEAVRNELYEKLISPVLPYVAGGTKELVIVPDGNLSFLPFDVLRKDADSKVLGDKYAVAFSPSVSVSVISGGKKSGEKNMLAFGGAWYDTKLTPGQHRANFTSEGISRGAKRGSQGIDFELTAENDAQRSFMKNDIQKNGPNEYFRAKNLVWQDLPGTITELNALKDGVFRADSFSQIVQEEASERTVKRLSQEGKLAQYPILHFACHGYFDNKIADMSSVLFSEVSLALEGSSDDDGYLTIPETAVLKLNADLVCLSACETGLGKIKAGDGMVGLSRAFMVAGAEQVGVSLWCVDDEATAKFMAAMYEKVVKKGMDYMSAYQKTKAEFRKDEDFDHPYYWAAFMLYE